MVNSAIWILCVQCTWNERW